MRHTLTAVIGVVWGGAIVGRTLAAGGLAVGSGAHGAGTKVGFAIGLILFFAGLVTLKNRSEGVEPVYPNGAASLLIVVFAACLTLTAARLAEPALDQRQLCQDGMAHFLELVSREYGPEGVEEYSIGALIEQCNTEHSARWADCVAHAPSVDAAVDCR